MALYRKDFAAVFSNLLKESGVTCYQIHQFAHLDEGYLSRLKNGEKNNPSLETVMKISLAFAHCSEKVTLLDIEDLLRATGCSILTK